MVGQPDAYRGEILRAFMVLRSGLDLNVKTMQTFCVENLSRYKLPALIQQMDALPKTAVNKSDKKVLKELARLQPLSWKKLFAGCSGYLLRSRPDRAHERLDHWQLDAALAIKQADFVRRPGHGGADHLDARIGGVGREEKAGQIT